jgi:natural product precursor
MKNKLKKLTLNRETLQHLTSLEQEELQGIVGGITSATILSCTCLN